MPIELRNVSKQYPENDKKAVNDISLRINDGEFIFIIGQSGAGKSTLTKLLTKEVNPDSGKIIVNGANVSNLNRRKTALFRRQIGVVFQDFRLIPTMTVYENIAFAMRVTDVDRKTIKERVPYVLKIVGLEGYEDKYPNHLSGGEQQRVAIARAIVHGPKLVIADEPTGNVDPDMGKDMMQLLNAISKIGITVIVITHEHELAKLFATRTITLKDGRIVADTEDINDGIEAYHASEKEV